MSGFPVAWEEPSSFDQLAELPPYSLKEMEDYLSWNHYHWVHDEKPTTFEVSGPHAEKQSADRRYWLFEANDRNSQQQWFIVVGTGKSPFNPKERMRRWMYAKTNDDDLSREQFLDEEYRDQLAHDSRSW